MKLLLSLGLLLCTCSLYAASASPKIYRALQQAQQQIEKQQYHAAQKRLIKLLPQAQSNYERALIQQTQGYAALGLNAHVQARDAFAAALNTQTLPNKVNQSLRRLLGQLWLQTGHPQRGLKLLRRWRKQAEPLKPDDHRLFARTYLALKQMDNAAWHLQQAINKTKKTPQVWYEQLLSAYLQGSKPEKAIPVVKHLLQVQPQQLVYWQQLVQLHLSQQQIKQALAVLQLAHRQAKLEEQALLPTHPVVLKPATTLDGGHVIRDCITSTKPP